MKFVLVIKLVVCPFKGQVIIDHILCFPKSLIKNFIHVTIDNKLEPIYLGNKSIRVNNPNRLSVDQGKLKRNRLIGKTTNTRPAIPDFCIDTI